MPGICRRSALLGESAFAAKDSTSSSYSYFPVGESMGNPFVIHKDDDPKSLPSDYCRFNQQHFAPEHVISRLQRNPFRCGTQFHFCNEVHSVKQFVACCLFLKWFRLKAHSLCCSCLSRRVGDVARERYAMDPWLPGSQLQRVVEREREREREREAPTGSIDPDRTDVDSMPDLVTVGGKCSQNFCFYLGYPGSTSTTHVRQIKCQVHVLNCTLSR